VANPAAPIRAARTGGQGRRPQIARTVQSPNVRGLAMRGPRPASKTGPTARMAQVTATSPTASRSSEEGTGAGGTGGWGTGAGVTGRGVTAAENTGAKNTGAENTGAENPGAKKTGGDGIGNGAAGKAGIPRLVSEFPSVETGGWGGRAMGKEKASGVPVGGWPRAFSGSGVNGGGPGGGSPRARRSRARRSRARRSGGVGKRARYSRSPKIAGSTSIPMGQ
jgi:hypothetical protein